MQLADTPFRALVLAAGALLMLLLGSLRFCGDFELPARPAKPTLAASDPKAVAQKMTGSSDAYNAYLVKDAGSFGITRVSPQTMSASFPYQRDDEKRVLAVGESVETLGLKLSVSEERLKGSKRSHLILQIENLAHKPVAYRIQTRPSGGIRSCAKMVQIPHNALAIAAGGLERRSECLFRSDSTLELTSIETMVVPELGYFYLSAVPPDLLGLDERHTPMHKAPSDAMKCQPLQSVSMRNAVASGEISWRDQVDFYARHRCQTYSLQPGYKAFQRDGEQNLPFSASDPQ